MVFLKILDVFRIRNMIRIFPKISQLKITSSFGQASTYEENLFITGVSWLLTLSKSPDSCLMDSG